MNSLTMAYTTMKKRKEVLEANSTHLNAGEVEELQALDDAMSEEIYQRPQRRTNPGPAGNMPPGWTGPGAACARGGATFAAYGDDQPALWRNVSTGELVLGLAKRHKLADMYAAENSGIEPHVIGRIIQAFASGRNGGIGDLSAAMGGNNNFAGGYLVPESLSSRWIDALRAQSVLVQAGAQTIPVSSDNLTIARVNTDPTIAPKIENAAFTETSLALDAVNFYPTTIGAVIYASRELAADAPNFAQVVETVLARKLAQVADTWGLCGVGVSTDLRGVMNLQGVTTTDASVGSIATSQYDEVIDAIEDVKTANGTPNAIISSPATKALYEKLRTGDGTNSSRDYLSVPEPVRSLPWLTTTGAVAGELYTGDFRSVLIGLRQGALLEFTQEAGDTFGKHQIGVKITMRIDFNCEHANLLAKLQGITA